jgi:hypothetical protein
MNYRGWKVWLLGGLTSVAGCGITAMGGTDDGNGAGGTGSDSLPAQGSVSFDVSNLKAPGNGAACPVASHSYQFGMPTTTDPGTRLISGQNGVLISCSVKGSSDFKFSASLLGEASGGDTIAITFTDGVFGADFSGTATVAVSTPQLAGTFTSSQPCVLSALNRQVKNGSLWASFSCPQVAAPPSGLCALSGVLVLENCAGS